MISKINWVKIYILRGEHASLPLKPYNVLAIKSHAEEFLQ